jgi:hypothetical protein
VATENILVKLAMNASDYVQGASRAKKATDGITVAAEKQRGSLRTLATQYGGVAKAAAGAFVAKAAVDFAKSSVKAFSDLQESLNAVEVGFGEGADAIKDFGKTAATQVGLSNAAFNQLSVTTGALLSNFIDDEQAAAEETIKLTQRAADMASVFNTSVPDALQATQAAIRGEMEPIRRFGVMLDDATIRAHAVEMGLADTTKEVDRQAKGLAALDLIYQQTDKTAGDFVNTSDGLANKQRILAARFEDVKAAVGESLAPVMDTLLDVASDLLPVIEGLGPALADFITGASQLAAWFRDIPGVASPATLAIGGVTAALALMYAHPVLAGLEIAELGRVDPSTLGDIIGAVEDKDVKRLEALGVSIKDIGKRLTSNDFTRETFSDTLGELMALNEQLGKPLNMGDLRELTRALVHLQNQYNDATLEAREMEAATDDVNDATGDAIGFYGDYATRLGRVATETEAVADASEDTASASDEAATAYGKLAAAADRTARAQDHATQAMERWLSRTAEAASPTLRLLRANQRLEEAQEALAEATGEDAVDALLDLIEAEAAAEVAAAGLAGKSAESYEAFLDLAVAAGIARDVAEDLATSLGLIPTQTDVDIDVSTNYSTSGTPPPARVVGGTQTSTLIPAFAHGGDFAAGEPIMVGEAGPELLIPTGAGSIVPNNQLSQNVTVHMEGSGDVYDDMTLALAMSGITEEIEWSGTNTLRG